jgi:hypothetical protein
MAPLRDDAVELHRKPRVEEQRIVVLSAYARPLELGVISVLCAQPHVGPRPYRGKVVHEGDVRDLSHEAAGIAVIKARVRRPPHIEILAAEGDPVVTAIGERSIQLQCIQGIRRIIGTTHRVGRSQRLVFVNVGAAQGDPVIVALILILGVESDVGVTIGQRGLDK